MISRETLLAEAGASGFRPEILEKVFLLMTLLNGLNRHPFLKGQLALKGGTALNLFVFDVPRLSVDVDLNYVGALDREAMQKDRPKLEHAITAVCERQGLSVTYVNRSHAGFSFRLRYESALGRGGDLKVELIFAFRLPLWPLVKRTSRSIGSHPASEFPVLDVHELAGGKLAALFARRASRDLFDVHLLLNQGDLDQKRLRLAFVLYGAMNAKDWRTVRVSDISFTEKELREQLIPVLRADLQREADSIAHWAEGLVHETRELVSRLLPLTESEKEFLDRLRDDGEIRPSLLTESEEMILRINQHPGLQWRGIKALQDKEK